MTPTRTKKLQLISANDTFGALVAIGKALAGEQAVFITPPEVNGKLPEVHGLPAEVPADTALIIESSGSTGTPKRISLRVEALITSASASELALGGPGQWLLTLPVNYIAGASVLVRSLVGESQPVMMNTALPFTADAFVRASSHLRGHPDTGYRFTSLVPTQLLRLAAAAEDDPLVLEHLRSFEAILIGGQAADPNLMAQLREAGVKLVETYGSTETCGGCFYDGKALDGVSARIDDQGRIQISGGVLANNVADSDGWFTTSDLGEIDTDGTLKVLGRTDRVLNSGGLKVSLDVVESVIRAIGGVNDAAATALRNPEWGESVAVLYTGSPEVADYIAGAVLSELGVAAKPVRVIRVDVIPKLANGKPDLMAIRDRFEVDGE